MTKEELLQKLTLVAMDHADITTLDKPIIGTPLVLEYFYMMKKRKWPSLLMPDQETQFLL